VCALAISCLSISMGDVMLRAAPVPFRKRPQGQSKPGRTTPRPPALNLVSASYATFQVTLSFDRAIDVSAFDVSTIFVNDAERSMALQGGGEFSLSDANTVSLSMSEIGDYEGGETVLIASANSGIVAVDDGGTWDGTEGTGLPFP
jgi:hypothetical protein